MDPLLSTLSSLIGKLSDVRSAEVLREHVALLKSSLELISQRLMQLQQDNAALVERNRELELQLSRQTLQDQMVEARDVLLKRKAGGGYSEVAYYPRCQNPLSGWEEFTLGCSSPDCRFVSKLMADEIPGLIASLDD